MSIHKTAIVSDKAKLGQDVSIGPYTIIGDNVVIGDGVKISSHCVIDGRTTLGKNCQIFSGAVVGSQPQDLKYKGEKSFLEIGENNIIREFCTFNPGTGEGSKTIVGNNNLFMAYCHVAHDCNVGSNCVIANNGTLAGHVTIQDRAVIGGLVAVHQFVRVGMLSIIGGCSKVVQDIPPFSTCDGHPALVYGLNLIGLRRNTVSREAIGDLDKAYKILFNSGLSLRHGLEKVKTDLKTTTEIKYLIDFLSNSQRGISHSAALKHKNTSAGSQD